MIFETFARWLVDYYLLATFLLGAALIAGWLVSQPARRVALTQATLVGLVLLAILCALPGWSVVHLMTRDAEAIPVVVAPEPMATEVVAAEMPTVELPMEAGPISAPSVVDVPPISIPDDAPTLREVSVSEVAVVAYFLGTLFAVVWQLLGHWRARALLREAAPASLELRQMLSELRGAAALSSPPPGGEGLGEGGMPRLLVSPALPTAVALGTLRPTILLPQKLIESTDSTALRTILAHELAHIRHGDLRLLALCRALFVLLWANPLFWLLRRRLRLDQETLADAAAAEVTTRHKYAEQLVDWAKRFATDRPPALAAAVGLWESPSQLRHRIAVLLDERLTIWRECSRRWRIASLAVCAGVAVGLSLVTLEPGAPNVASAAESSIRADDPSGSPENPPRFLGIRVVNESGTPIVGAVVKPFALTNETNGAHSGWFHARDGRGKPQEHTTDSFGMATVRYPTFVRERIRTQVVSVEVAHSDYVLDTAEVAVSDEAALVQLKRAGKVEIAARLPGQSNILDNVYGMGDKFQAYGTKWTRLKDGSIRSPGLATGRKVGVRAVWIPVDGPVHFSKIVQVELAAGETQQLKLEVFPGSKLVGNLASNVPRPVTNGKVIAEIDSPGETGWYEWTTIQADGSFEFASLPRDKGEVVQLFAICDGFVSKPPTAIEEGPYRGRPQTIVLGDEVLRHAMEMIPTAKCIVTLRDTDGNPIPNACIRFSPNSVTTSGGSAFAHPLRRSSDILRGLATWLWSREEALKDYPHQAISDHNGEARLTNLPPFHPFTFNVEHDDFELPIREVNGRKERSGETELKSGRLTRVEVLMQMRGEEFLGGDGDSNRNLYEAIGNYFILCPVTTNLQRSLLGDVSKPATDAALHVFVNGTAFTDDQIDAGSPEFVKLKNRLEESAKSDNRRVIFRVIVFRTGLLQGEKLRQRADTLSHLCEQLGREAGFKRSTRGHRFTRSDFDWAKFIADASTAADQAVSKVEDAVGDDRVQVFPVRTFLSRLLVNADCVVNIVPVMGQNEGNRFPDDFAADMTKLVPQANCEQTRMLWIRVRFAESARERLEQAANDIEGRKLFAKQLGFENCNLSQTLTNEAEAEQKPAATEGAKAKAEPNTISGRCVNERGQPVAGAEVHLFQFSQKDKRYLHFGPLKSDEQGKAQFDDPIVNEEGRFDRWFYVRVPGQLVGVARSASWQGQAVVNSENQITLWPSRSVEGQVTVPTNFNPEDVVIRVRTMHVLTGPSDSNIAIFPREINFPGLDTSLPEIFERRPNAKGRIRFDDIPIEARLYLVTAATGLGEAQWRNEGRTLDDPIQLTLEKEARLVGRVFRPDEKPAVGMKVVARLTSSEAKYLSTFRTETDNEGKFSLNGLPGLEFALYVEGLNDELVFRPMESLVVLPDRTMELDLHLEAGVLVSGRVIDSDGNPVQGAALSAISNSNNGVGLADDSTDAKGSYQLRLPSGGARLYFNSLPDGFAYPDPQIVKNITIEHGQKPIENLDFTLQRKQENGSRPDAVSKPKESPKPAANNGAKAKAQPNTITGRCVDENDKPLSGVKVSLYSSRRKERQTELMREVTTGVDGTYQFENVVDIAKEFPEGLSLSLEAAKPDQVTLLVVARAPDRATTMTSHWNAWIAAKGLEASLLLPPSAILRGVVTEPQGKPVSGARVSVVTPNSPPLIGMGGSAVTDAQGRYEITDVRAFDLVQDRKEKERQRGENEDTLSVSGGVELSAEILPLLMVEHPEFATKKSDYDRIPGTRDVQLEPAAILEGRVIYADTGRPAEGVAVTAVTSRTSDLLPGPETIYQHHTATVRTDAEGRFNFSTLTAGTYDIWPETEGWLSPGVGSVRTAVEKPTVVDEMKLTRGGEIRMRLVDSVKFEPIKIEPGDEVRASIAPVKNLSARPFSAQLAKPEADGTFTIHALPGENILIFQGLISDNMLKWVAVQREGLASKNVDVVDGKTVSVDVPVDVPTKPREVGRVAPYSGKLAEAAKLNSDRKPREAMKVLDEILQKEPNHGEALLTRAWSWEQLGEYHKQIADYKRVIAASPGTPQAMIAYNNWAYILATSIDKSLRNGKRAVELAEKAMQLAQQPTPDLLDTLAAAFAEAGDYDRAIAAQNEAIKLAPDRKSFRENLKLYEAGKPRR